MTKNYGELIVNCYSNHLFRVNGPT